MFQSLAKWRRADETQLLLYHQMRSQSSRYVIIMHVILKPRYMPMDSKNPEILHWRPMGLRQMPKQPS